MPTVSPVIFLIFNRPQTTAITFEKIRQARPPVLIVVADGPRQHKPNEFEHCMAARAVTEQVDWPCTVHRLYSDVNLGCERRVSTGISQAFEIVEEAIILEDDCLPDDSFFTYVDDLLTRYRNDSRVVGVSGNNFQGGIRRTSESYYFTKYMHIWGWATWRRGWELFDFQLKDWPAFVRNGGYRQWHLQKDELAFWNMVYAKLMDGSLNSWALRWQLSVWMYGGVTAIPEVNLVRNIGYGADATTTKDTDSELANLPMESVTIERHPSEVKQHVLADRYTFDTRFSVAFPKPLTLFQRAMNQMKRVFFGVGRRLKGLFLRKKSSSIN